MVRPAKEKWMASRSANVEKVGSTVGVGQRSESIKKLRWVSVLVVMMRVLAFLATASATLVMALNKETRTLVVATVGTTPVTATIIANFHYTPAFVFFVIANGLVSLHNLLMLAAELFGDRVLDHKGFRLAIIAILDMVNVAVISGGASGAAFMAELGRNGNSHARWEKICDRFQTFCDHGGGALAASFVGLLLMLIISTISILKFFILNISHHLHQAQLPAA